MISQQEWLNSNAARNFPIQEDSSRQALQQQGSQIPGVLLPNYVLVDACLTVPGDLGLRVYLAQLAFVGDTVSMVFCTSDGGTLLTVAVPSVQNSTGPFPYPVVGIGVNQDCRGWIVVGDLTRLSQDLPEGVYYFGPAQTMLEARCTRPALRGVRSLSVTNQGTTSAPLSGNVNLYAGANVSLRYDPANNGIWISAVPNAGYQEACPCSSASQSTLVKTINGIAIQDVTIVGDGQCVQVTTSGNTITISDSCSTPCCGCPELDFLNQTIDTINSSLTRLEQYSQQLNSSITAFTTNYILTVGM